MQKRVPSPRSWMIRVLPLCLVVPLLGVAPFALRAQEGEEGPQEAAPADPAREDRETALDARQRALAARYRRFERTLEQMAQYMRKTDPDRAHLLERAIRLSREGLVTRQMEQVVELLDRQQFGGAIERQEELMVHLQAVLELLQSEAEQDRLKQEQERIQDLIKALNRVLVQEKDLRAATERGENAERLAQRQERIAGEARELSDTIADQDRERSAGRDGTPASGDGQDGDGSDGDGQNGGEVEGDSPDGQDGEAGPEGEGQDGDSAKPGDEDAGDSQPGDGQPGDGEPGDGEPGDGEPGDSQPSDGEPGDGESGDGEPGDGESGDGESGDGQSGESGEPGEGEPGDSQPSQSQPGQPRPGDPDQRTPGREEIERSIEEMERAIEELKKKNHEEASTAQDEAIRELEEAKARLEEILRQLREEERRMLLTALEARFQKMLALQKMVYNGTVSLDQVPKDDWSSRHFGRARELSQREDEIALDAARALELLKEEGSSVAFPEAIEQVRTDMITVARRLERTETGEFTQAIELDIIEALEEVIEALQRELEQLNEEQEPQEGEGGEPPDPALVDQLAELKMLRSLQLRVNRRTRQLSRLIADGAEQATDPEVVDGLQELSRRQARIQEATYNLATGRNE